MYNQTQFNNSMNEYIKETKKSDFRDNVVKIIMLLIAVFHKIFAHPYLSELLRKTLTDNEVSEMTIEYILYGYLVFSVLFIIVAIWQIVRNIKIVNIIYIIGVIGFVGYFGYNDFKTTKIYDQLTNKPKVSFVIEAKELCNKAKTYWQKESITNSPKQVTYIKSNNIFCNGNKFAITDDSIEYSISIDTFGNIIDYKITNGRFQYSYNGDNLEVDSITSDKFVKVDDTNRIVIPECYN